jgi:hypothetical protein
MRTTIEDILLMPPVDQAAGDSIGESREGRTIKAFRLGAGPCRVSLLAGCHADEPVGPLLLRHLVQFLRGLPPSDPMLKRYQWWIIPHINPDGAERNRAWYDDADSAYDLGRYLRHVVRELPGDDIEFGFPRDDDDAGARPENRAAYDWWRSAEGPFALHATLHGMGFAAGPWYLLEEAWQDRVQPFKEACGDQVEELGYHLHDVERHGEKGFVRLDRGFCTRPDSGAMRRFFLDRDEPEMASRFRPSSMETIRGLGGDPLTLVSEMPLFITPGVGEVLGPPDPVAVEWKDRVEEWRVAVRGDRSGGEISEAGRRAGLRPMPVRDQMTLQWGMLVAGLQLVGG